MFGKKEEPKKEEPKGIPSASEPINSKPEFKSEILGAKVRIMLDNGNYFSGVVVRHLPNVVVLDSGKEYFQINPAKVAATIFTKASAPKVEKVEVKK